jgi:hypothetical protein
MTDTSHSERLAGPLAGSVFRTLERHVEHDLVFVNTHHQYN